MISLLNILRLLKQRGTCYSASQFQSCGENVIIHENCIFSHPQKTKIGSNVYIGPGCRFFSGGELEIGTNVVFGSNVSVLTMNHHYDAPDLMYLPYDDRNDPGRVIIENNSWIAYGVLIMPGVKIGHGAVVAAGSVVTGEIPPLAVAAGNPAKVVKYRDSGIYEHLENKSWLSAHSKRYSAFRIK